MSAAHSDMTLADITALHRLNEAATVGPWSAIGNGLVFGSVEDTEAVHCGPMRKEDAALIVAMRNDMPRLLATVFGMMDDMRVLEAENQNLLKRLASK